MSQVLHSNQNEPPNIGKVELVPESFFEQWLIDYDPETVNNIADLWQKHAGKRYKNVIVAKEEDGEAA